ncbi:MAG: AAA family ATPase [Gracilimonas sp.]
MLIKKISIENFQCYFGPLSENAFEFTKGVNIIAGNNGAGKSKLFNAFHWALFGKIYTNHNWVETDKIGHRFVSNRAKSLSDEGVRIKCSVELVIEAPNFESGQDNVTYTFLRKIVIEKQQGNWKIMTPESLEISYKKDTGETEFVDSLKNESVIDQVFPPALRKYMWFQGEAIDSLLDFNNPNTLKFAIKKISYYPYYERIHEITSSANRIISKSISKHLSKSKKANQELTKLLGKIDLKDREYDSLNEEIIEAREKHEEIKEKIHETETALKNYDGYQDFESKLTDIEHRDEKLSMGIDSLGSEYREKFVTKWMLKGTQNILKDSDKILEEFSDVIREKSETDNPIPLKIPGKKYIQQMLDDEHCHICERSAPKGSDEYKAMQKRLGESKNLEEEAKEKQRMYNELEMNYMYLSNKPSELIEYINEIDSEIKDWDKKISDLIQKRIDCKREKEKLETENDVEDIKKGASTAKQLTSNLIFYKDEEKKQSRHIERKESHRLNVKKEIDDLKKERKKFESDEEKIVEQDAEIYFKLLEIITDELKDKALTNLINDIENRANDLYKKYLENSQSPDGYLNIDPKSYEVIVLDDGKRKDINQGHEVAAKMSVINAILSLSAEKLGKSYPLVADAPSSVFDKANTKSYTKKISETFDQVILISKDYSAEMDMKFLDEIDQIKRVYQIENRIVDNGDVKSETNNRTFNDLVKPK